MKRSEFDEIYNSIMHHRLSGKYICGHQKVSCDLKDIDKFEKLKECTNYSGLYCVNITEEDMPMFNEVGSAIDHTKSFIFIPNPILYNMDMVYIDILCLYCIARDCGISDKIIKLVLDAIVNKYNKTVAKNLSDITELANKILSENGYKIS